MGLTLNMSTRNDFVPVHGEKYIAFTVSDFYGDVEFRQLECEFTYQMIDAEDGYPVPSTACYDATTGGDLPFDVPFLFDDNHMPYLLTEAQIAGRKCHSLSVQRFWWVKTWFLSDRNHYQLHPEELDSESIGIMPTAQFISSVREANVKRKEMKYGGEND